MNCSQQLHCLQSRLLRRSNRKTALLAATTLVFTSRCSSSTAFVSAPANQREIKSSICESDPSTAASLSIELTSSMENAQNLQIQWAGGRDVWPKIPTENGFVSIQTKLKEPDSEELPRSATDWPKIVEESTLFGFGAYNPRGKTLSDAINRNQHVLLQKDIEQYLENIPQSVATYWEGASIWENSSSEKGFILAFREEKERGLELSIDLARSYNQGAIYQFSMREDGRLIRDTIAVLDKGTDATVEVVIDFSVDLSPFL